MITFFAFKLFGSLIHTTMQTISSVMSRGLKTASSTLFHYRAKFESRNVKLGNFEGSTSAVESIEEGKQFVNLFKMLRDKGKPIHEAFSATVAAKDGQPVSFIPNGILTIAKSNDDNKYYLNQNGHNLIRIVENSEENPLEFNIVPDGKRIVLYNCNF